MNETDTTLLTSIYQNCKTATQSIHDLMPRVQNVGLLQELKNEYDNYIDFVGKCLDYAKQNKVCLNENNIFEKMRLWFSVKLSTLFNKTTRHVTEMLLLGTVMGTTQCFKDIHDHSDASPEILKLCEELLTLEETHFNNLKSFLKNL